MQQSNQNMENKNNDLTEIITQALNEMKMELGESFNIDKVNLAELERRTGITRAKLRRLKSNGLLTNHMVLPVVKLNIRFLVDIQPLSITFLVNPLQMLL